MKKRIWSIVCFLFIFVGSSSIITASTNDWEDDYKYYTSGIVDGGAYKIKNVQTGLYMTLANGSVSSGTKIVLSISATSENQMFFVKYLGDNRYIFEPFNSSLTKFGVSSASSGTHLSLSAANNTTTSQRFRITALSSNQCTIATNISSYLNVLHAEYDTLLGWSVVHGSRISLSETEMKWKFEKVDDRACDIYTTYFLRDNLTNLYLTVVGTGNGSQLSLRPFIGNENQRIKRKWQNNGNGFGYYYIPMIKTDTAVELNSNTILNLYDKEENQKFTETYNSISGGYKLSAQVGGSEKFISKGSSYTYGSKICYYLNTTTVSGSAIDFEFEIAYGETPFIQNLSIETTYTKTTSNFAEKNIYTIRPNVSGDYTFFVDQITGNPGIVVYNSNGVWMPGTVTNFSGGQK